MHINQAIYVHISNSLSDSILYVFLAVYLAVFLYVVPTVFLAVYFVHIHNRHGAVMAASRSPNFAGAGARSLQPLPRGPYYKFVARQRKRGQTAIFNQIRSADQIRSARLNSGVQRQLAQARLGCALKCHGNLGWQLITR
jgi:hypothetical protein